MFDIIKAVIVTALVIIFGIIGIAFFITIIKGVLAIFA